MKRQFFFSHLPVIFFLCDIHLNKFPGRLESKEVEASSNLGEQIYDTHLFESVIFREKDHGG